MANRWIFDMLYRSYAQRLVNSYIEYFVALYIQSALIYSTTVSKDELAVLIKRIESDRQGLAELMPNMQSTVRAEKNRKKLDYLIDALSGEKPRLIASIVNLKICMKELFNQNCVVALLSLQKCIFRMRSDCDAKDRQMLMDIYERESQGITERLETEGTEGKKRVNRVSLLVSQFIHTTRLKVSAKMVERGSITDLTSPADVPSGEMEKLEREPVELYESVQMAEAKNKGLSTAGLIRSSA